jgi:TetR/AcrR family transcriptional repressor of nem operon
MSSKRDDLLSSAKSLLWERGYEATSPRDIQKASGAGQGSFYHHFNSKLDLAETALDEVSAEMRQAASELLDAGTPGMERVVRFLQQSRNGLKGCPMGRFAGESSIFEPRLRAPIDAFFDHLGKLLEAALRDAQRSGALRSTEQPEDLATMLVAVVQGGYVLSRVSGDGDAVNRATAAALHLLRDAS